MHNHSSHNTSQHSDDLPWHFRTYQVRPYPNWQPDLSIVNLNPLPKLEKVSANTPLRLCAEYSRSFARSLKDLDTLDVPHIVLPEKPPLLNISKIFTLTAFTAFFFDLVAGGSYGFSTEFLVPTLSFGFGSLVASVFLECKNSIKTHKEKLSQASLIHKRSLHTSQMQTSQNRLTNNFKDELGLLQNLQNTTRGQIVFEHFNLICLHLAPMSTNKVHLDRVYDKVKTVLQLVDLDWSRSSFGRRGEVLRVTSLDSSALILEEIAAAFQNVSLYLDGGPLQKSKLRQFWHNLKVIERIMFEPAAIDRLVETFRQ